MGCVSAEGGGLSLACGFVDTMIRLLGEQCQGYVSSNKWRPFCVGMMQAVAEGVTRGVAFAV